MYLYRQVQVHVPLLTWALDRTMLLAAACYMYMYGHSPLGGGGYGSAHGEGVTGEDHTREAGHGVIYQGLDPQRALIGAGGKP